MLKLKLQYFGHLMWRTDSFEKTLMLGMIEGGRWRGWQRMRWLDGISDSMDMSFEQGPGVGDEQGNLVCCSPWCHKESDTTKQLNLMWKNTSRTRSHNLKSRVMRCEFSEILRAWVFKIYFFFLNEIKENLEVFIEFHIVRRNQFSNFMIILLSIIIIC